MSICFRSDNSPWAIQLHGSKKLGLSCKQEDSKGVRPEGLIRANWRDDDYDLLKL